MSNHLLVLGDVSFQQDLEISDNLIVHDSVYIDNSLNVTGKTFLTDDVSMSNHLLVLGDVSFQQDLEISDNLVVHDSVYIDNSLNVTGKTFLTDDVSMSNHLLVLGDVSFQQDLEISDNLMVHDSVYIDNSLNVTGKTFLTDDVSMSNHLLVLGDVSFQQDLEISDNVIVHDSVYIDNSLNVTGKTFLTDDVSMSNHLLVLGDVSFNQNLDISDSVHIYQNLDVDVSCVLETLDVFGHSIHHNTSLFRLDASFEDNVYIDENLSINNNLYVNNTSLFNKDVSFNDDVYIEKTLDVSGNTHMYRNVLIDGEVDIFDDVSMNQNLVVHEKMTVHNDVSLNKNVDISDVLHITKNSGTGLIVDSDVYFDKDFKVDGSVEINTDISCEQYVSDVSFTENVHISDTSKELTVHAKSNFYNNLDFSGVTLSLKNSVIDICNNDTGIDITAQEMKTNTMYANEYLYNGKAYHRFNQILLESDATYDGSAKFDVDVCFNNFTLLNNDIVIGSKKLTTDDDVMSYLTDTCFNVIAHQGEGIGIVYDGDVTIGNPSHVNSDLSGNLGRQFTIYGDLRIKDGGNIVIEDISNSTITQLQTETKVTDILQITNEGTGPSLIVNQTETDYADIVHFQDDGINVAIIGAHGNTSIAGKLRVDVSGIETGIDDDFTLTGISKTNHEYSITISGDSYFGGDSDFMSDVFLDKKYQQNTTEGKTIFQIHDVGTLYKGTLDPSAAVITSQIPNVGDDGSTNSSVPLLYIGRVGHDTNQIYSNYANFSISRYKTAGEEINDPRTRLDFNLDDTWTPSAGLTTNNVMSLLSEGKVGINTNLPEYDLDVSGTIRIKESLHVEGFSNLTDVHLENMFINESLHILGKTDFKDISSSYVDVSVNLSVAQHSLLNDISGTNLDLSNNLNVESIAELGQLFVHGTTVMQDLSCGNIESSGNLIVSNNQDQYAKIGKLHLSHNSSLGSDFVSLRHDNNGGLNESQYMIGQDNVGKTIINRASGQNIEFRYDNNDTETNKVIINGNHQMGIKCNPGYELDVNGVAHIRDNFRIEKDMFLEDGSANIWLNGENTSGKYFNVNYDGSFANIITNEKINIDVSGSNKIMVDKNDTSFTTNVNIEGTTTLNDNVDISSSTITFNTDVILDHDASQNFRMREISDNNIEFYTNNIKRLAIRSDGDIDICNNIHLEKDININGTMSSSSDIRIKDNLEEIPDCMNKIFQIKGFSYTRKDLIDKEKRHIGVIAQDVEKQFPEIVNEDINTGIKQVNYHGLIPILIECVKELKNENLELRTMIQDILSKK